MLNLSVTSTTRVSVNIRRNATSEMSACSQAVCKTSSCTQHVPANMPKGKDCTSHCWDNPHALFLHTQSHCLAVSSNDPDYDLILEGIKCGFKVIEPPNMCGNIGMNNYTSNKEPATLVKAEMIKKKSWKDDTLLAMKKQNCGCSWSYTEIRWGIWTYTWCFMVLQLHVQWKKIFLTNTIFNIFK